MFLEFCTKNAKDIFTVIKCLPETMVLSSLKSISFLDYMQD